MTVGGKWLEFQHRDRELQQALGEQKVPRSEWLLVHVFQRLIIFILRESMFHLHIHMYYMNDWCLWIPEGLRSPWN